MSGSSRRGFCRALWGLACVGVGGCKIDPILGIRSQDDSLPPVFPELPAQIPDQLADAETTLRALTEQLLERELPRLTIGDLRERPSDKPTAVAHFVELMRSFGLGPAGNRGGWLLPVMLDIVEPTGGVPVVAMRPDTEAPVVPPPIAQRVDPVDQVDQVDQDGSAADVAPADQVDPVDQVDQVDQIDPLGPGHEVAPVDPDKHAEQPEAPQPAAPAEPPQPAAPAETPEPADQAEPPPQVEPVDPADPAVQATPAAAPNQTKLPPSRAIDLTALGAFRQRGDATPYVGLLLGPVLDYKTPLPAERLAGRVVVVRAPKDLDLASDDAGARIDLVMSTLRDAGALGCLLLTSDDGTHIERFRIEWQRQVRRTGGADQAMLIEGLLPASARKPIQAALAERDTNWMIDVDLAMRSYEVESNNVIGRVTGRDRPDEAVVLTCHWDTPDPQRIELHTLRLLATIGAFFQLAEWSRRSTPPPYSLVLLLTVDAGLGAGQAVHAAWSANYGAQTTALLALDSPTSEPLPAVLLSGHYDTQVVTRARRVVAADGRELLLDDQLSMPSLAPYLRYPALVMTIGAPDPDTLDGLDYDLPEDMTDEEEEADPLAELHGDIRLLRNLMLALAARGR